MTDEPEDPWKRLVDQAKTAPPDEPGQTPPTVSIKTLRGTVQSLLLALTWRKWSLVAAVLASILFLIFYFFLRDNSPPDERIIPSDPPPSPAAP